MPRLPLAFAFLVLVSSAQADDCIAHSTWANWRGSLVYFGLCWSSTGNHNNTDGVYVGNEPLIPPQCRKTPDGRDGWWGTMGGRVEGQTIRFGAGALPMGHVINPDCKLTFQWAGRIINKKPIRLCTVRTVTMPSGQVITGWETFWLVGQGTFWPQGPWVWSLRPQRDGCGHRGHVVDGPQRVPDPTIPRPPIQPPPTPSPSPYVK